jgi:hypothetical protein
MRVLVVTFAFPPGSHANAKRPCYVVKAMLEAGWEVDVMTTPSAELGESVTHPRCRIHRISSPVHRIASLGKLGSWWERSVTLAGNGLLWPESYRLWVGRVFRACRERMIHYDRVLAYVFPASVLMAGGIPGFVDSRWVFDMQEPVSSQYALVPRRSPLQRMLTPRLARVERQALHQAGGVIFTSATNLEACVASGLAPRATSWHIPCFFDAEAFTGSVACEQTFTIGYFGNFDIHGHRSPAVFLKALAVFLSEHPEAREKTRFLFHGTWLSAHDRLLEDLGLHDVAAIRGPLSFADYLGRIRSCPVLLLVAAAEHNLFMPSKLVDYLGAARPILAFAPRNSEVAGVLRMAGMHQSHCPDSDWREGADAIGRLWQRFVTGSLASGATDIREWSSATQIPRYMEILQSGVRFQT